MPPRTTPAAADPPRADQLAYPEMIAAYDRRTRAAYEVMGARWGRFLAAKEQFLAAERGSREWYVAGERAYRLGLRSTHAYYLWTSGHTALALETLGALPDEYALRLRLRQELQSLHPSGRRSHRRAGGDAAAMAGESKTTTHHDEIRRWVEERGGRPARVQETGSGDDPGILRIDFPGRADDDRLEEISWEDWFEAFEENGLAFVYQDDTSGGDESRVSKLVSR